MHTLSQNKIVVNFEILDFYSYANPSLCGAHALERVGEMKSQKIQKGGLSDSVDENDVLVKSVEQGWGFRLYNVLQTLRRKRNL